MVAEPVDMDKVACQVLLCERFLMLQESHFIRA
jgi:hypothetical protein